MSKILKLCFKILLIVLLVFLIINLISTLLVKSGIDFGGLFNNEVVEQTPLENGLQGVINGGLTPEQFEEQRKDEEAPYSGDEVKDFYIRETDKYVVFTRPADLNGTTIFPNISFVKTEKGLVWDGAWGVTCEVHTNWWTGKRDYENATWKTNFVNNTLEYSKSILSFWKAFYLTAPDIDENIITFSDFNENFCVDFYHCNAFALLFQSRENEQNKLQQITHKYLVENVLIPYFEILGNGIELEMGVDDAETLSKLNSCYTYLWNNLKTEDMSNNERIIDISTYYGKIIPESEREKYPISEDKQAEYGDDKYYSAYFCKIFANCYYEYLDIKVDRDEHKIKDYTKDHKVDIVPENQSKEYSELVIKFSNKNNSDLTGLDLITNPVKVEINNITLTFDSLETLKNGKSIVIERNSTLPYIIISDALVFDSYSGSISINNRKIETYFQYSYVSGYVPVSVGLQPLATYDYSKLDLSSEPFCITFYSVEDSSKFYSFLFDSNEKLSQNIVQYLPVGEYTVSVLSHSKINCYASETITVSGVNRKFMFTIQLKSEAYDTYIHSDPYVYVMRDENGDLIETDVLNHFEYEGFDSDSLFAFKDAYSKYLDDNPNVKAFIKLFDDNGKVLADVVETYDLVNECRVDYSLNVYTNFEDEQRFNIQSFLYLPNGDICVSHPGSSSYQADYVNVICLNIYAFDSGWWENV